VRPVAPRSKELGRISAIEVAIKAHAKRFLAHTQVVQLLESVWAGEIVFASAADGLHRLPIKKKARGDASQLPAKYGALETMLQNRTVQYHDTPTPRPQETALALEALARKSVTIYDPSDASVFKLSRLRVPRYRQLFSTVSYATMLGLFLAVLIERSLSITFLELVFWFWSAGYMLDELVGFSEQGFGLYIISVWNAFDIGILLMFMSFYILRIYGILFPDKNQYINNMAYDVLAATAVLLLPRLFSVLDHYRYFSQLLIAFRMMAVDLVAVLILIMISCSGFVIAFTLSFAGKDMDFEAAVYALFQILMGYTPAAWEIWDEYNFLGKILLVAFLIICHFLIVTILVTVLTNSFMAVVQNANEEHQFLFAVNTISMVKSDALFSYIPPTNILAWFLSPLRFCMPFRTFVYLNRTVIKATHVPILLGIFIYERIVLTHRVFDPTDLIEQRGRSSARIPAFSIRAGDLFSPGTRLREPSLVTYRKDQVLDEVFRMPYPDSKSRTIPDEDPFRQHRSKAAVRNWMQEIEREGSAGEPLEDQESVLERLDRPVRPMQPLNRSKTDQGHLRAEWPSKRGHTSEPDDGAGPSLAPGSFNFGRAASGFGAGTKAKKRMDSSSSASVHFAQLNTDQDGDDELGTNTNTNDEDEVRTIDRSFEGRRTMSRPEQLSRQSSMGNSRSMRTRIPLEELGLDDSVIEDEDEEVDPVTPIASRHKLSRAVHSSTSPDHPSTQKRVSSRKIEESNSPIPGRSGKHNRTTSSATMVFIPLGSSPQEGSATSPPMRDPGPSTVSSLKPSRPRFSRTAAFPPSPEDEREYNSGNFLSGHSHAHDFSSPLMGTAAGPGRRKPSYGTWALDLASDIGDNRAVGDVGLLSTSFASKMEIPSFRGRHLTFGKSTNGKEKRHHGQSGAGNNMTTDTKFRELMLKLEGVSRMEGEVREMLTEMKRMTKSLRESRAGSVDVSVREGADDE
jgi:hypothetical protein